MCNNLKNDCLLYYIQYFNIEIMDILDHLGLISLSIIVFYKKDRYYPRLC